VLDPAIYPIGEVEQGRRVMNFKIAEAITIGFGM
jgi:hypothetical protein